MEQIWWLWVVLGLGCTFGAMVAKERILKFAAHGAGIAFCVVGVVAAFWRAF